MKIEPLEVKLVKSSKIEDGDIIIVKVNSEDKKHFDQENIKNLYAQIRKMIGEKNISIYFFPKHFDIDFIKNQVEIIEENKENIQTQAKEKNEN
jgi:spore germination protein GerM